MKLLLTILSIIWWLNGMAGTIQVGGKYALTSIKKAISLAVEGDTILVHPGIYKEGNIIINKRIFLKGVKLPILDGEHKFELISIKANGVVVDGFKIVHSGVSSMEDMGGIKIYDCRDVVIQNNVLEDTFFGIYTQFGKNCSILNNRLKAYSKEEQQSGNGIHCWKSDSMRIIGNTVSGHRDGIYFEFVTHSIIWRNYSYENIRYGLHFMFSNEDAYISNQFKGNGAGVAVMFSHGVKMFSNRFEENWGDASYGLLLKEISDSYIEANIFIKNTSGIYMEGASRIQLFKNLFENNGWALKIQASCMDIEVANNNFLGNSFDVSTNGSLVLNSFNGNFWDKYEGYDLNKDKVGDLPYRPVSMYSMIVEKHPPAMLLFRSFITTLLDKTEKILPSITPEGLKDNFPLMKKAF
ncbi:MAG: nitrous oxide reductase [Bacteroidetes bacterium 24-39-8]|nr:MAG: nitrous oxide reductase [Bacteroidetes bacterium 24-39-8]HQS53630.1 nitrous oxide reductase family maturation protein NosD [Sediminibacterium sp.]